MLIDHEIGRGLEWPSASFMRASKICVDNANSYPLRGKMLLRSSFLSKMTL